jgi:hypothetical protein
MNTPFNPLAWRRLFDRGAAFLPSDFADRVLRAHRAADALEGDSWLSNPFTVSAATAALCLGLLVLFHAQQTHSMSELHLADWQEISAQTASIDPAP